MTKPRIIVLSDKYTEASLQIANAMADVEVIPNPNPNELVSAVSRANALAIRTNVEITAALLDNAKILQVIGRAGVGLDNVDLQACRKRNIKVVYTPEAATDAVADLAIGMMVTLKRFLREGEAQLRSGDYQRARRTLIGRDMRELTVGIIGFGRIGQAIGKRFRLGFGGRVIFHDICPTAPVSFDAQQVDFDMLLQDADIISLNVPLTPDTSQMINDESLRLVRRGAMLINTARGKVVDTEALCRSLGDGHLGAAGLDVTNPEPLPIDHPLLSMPQVVITPHIGASTQAAQNRMSLVIEDILKVLGGEEPSFPA